MAKQDERQRSMDPRDSKLGDEERIRGLGDTGEPPEDEDEDDFDDAEELGDEDDEEASF